MRRPRQLVRIPTTKPPRKDSVFVYVDGLPGWAHLGLIPRRTVKRPKRRHTRDERITAALDAHLGLTAPAESPRPAPEPAPTPAPDPTPTLTEPLTEELKYTPPDKVHPAVLVELEAKGYIWMKPRTRKARGSEGLSYVRGFWRRSRRKTSTNRSPTP